MSSWDNEKEKDGLTFYMIYTVALRYSNTPKQVRLIFSELNQLLSIVPFPL
jgi:hypothetical protein